MPDGGTVKGVVDGVIADPHDLGQQERDHSDSQAADHGLQVFGQFQLLFKQVLAPVKGFYKGKGHYRAQEGQDKIKEQFVGAFKQICGYLKSGEIPLELVGDDRGHDRRDDDGRYLCKTEVAEDNFDCEKRTSHRRIESCGNSGRRTAADKGFHALGGDPEKLADGRAQAGTDLDDRPFAPNRSACSDGDGGGQRLDKGHPRPDGAAFHDKGLHDLGNAVAFGLAGKEIDKRTYYQPAQRRGPEGSPTRARP